VSTQSYVDIQYGQKNALYALYCVEMAILE
jgi:hypothetical protein